MAVYADKNAKGELTGRFRVEVRSSGRHLRDRCDTFAQAQEREDDFLAEVMGTRPSTRKPVVRTDARVKLRTAVDLADGQLWRGLASETDFMTKLRRLILILGDVELDDIGHHEFDRIISVLEEGGATPATVNRYLSAYDTFLKWCLSREYRTRPLPKLEWQKESEGRVRWITEDEEAALEESLPSHIWHLVRSAIKTGMRRSELIYLEPEQVEWLDADNCGWVHLWRTKNGTPRSVPIDYETYEDLMFLSDGRMPRADSLGREWNRARKAMGLEDDPWFVFRCCRHTCATRLVQANVNLAVVKEFMGHKTIETTLRYAHVNDTGLTDALRSLNIHRNKVAPLGVPSDAVFSVVPHSGLTLVPLPSETP